VVPGASLAQLYHAAHAAFPAAPYGLSLRTSLPAVIVHTGALSNIGVSMLVYLTGGRQTLVKRNTVSGGYTRILSFNFGSMFERSTDAVAPVMR